MRAKVMTTAGILLVSCNQPAVPDVPEAANSQSPAPAAATQAATQAAPPAATPPRRSSLPEPKGPIDPRSAEAAGQVVQLYGALIEQGRWSASWKLWSDPEAARQFDRNWRDLADVHLEIGELGGVEGAAGSSFTTVPVFFYGQRKAGGGYREKAGIILRRVNEVPGSTAAQRRWHIERIAFFRI